MNEKKTAGEKAAEFVEDGMTIGLGTGSTVYYTIRKIGERVQNGLKITGVPTSQATAVLARGCGIPLADLNDTDTIDLTIDGADEVDPALNGIKGGGGALLFEKLVANASKKNIWVVDHSKQVEKLGAYPLPVEVIPFGWKQIMKIFEEKGFRPVLRMKNGQPFQTDGGHYIVDIRAGHAGDMVALGKWLDGLTGVVEHGLFLGTCDLVVVGDGESVSMREKPRETGNRS
ncbi:ribose-5-phosphate isomerase A [Weizmannia acidilactici]|uniref:Ribose-5-phosphate isomerase A n=1 Tax=Weizmannia acidilactici TaxID=2607726 RepID=A0A5J4JF20_9BACI|nr:ribose-5-phosphate isomerase RpiA [Weizmannia acidilactici]GER67689.1 ribose-5-phosphate isomerase A [Weizmannia acidilactici]GER68928.1 ribose-5-phosphate isomerase A [Weizmannia acidilactici]GER73890.1 ribose-5-phosphate isomerase A [Weizmannia acidilactici]